MKITYLILLLLGSFFFIDSNAQSSIITVDSKRNTDRSVSFSFQKKKFGTYFLSVWFTRLNNANSSGYNGEIVGAAGQLFTLKPSTDNQDISYSYKYWYIRGKLKPNFDPDFLYFLPTGLNKEASVYNMTNLSERYFGSARPKSWAAYQFIVSEGDTAFAARKGEVVEIVSDNDYHTDVEVSYQSTINTILIEHADGTFARYEGINKSGILVKEGQYVYPGTPLGTVAKYDKREQGQLRFSLFYLDFVDPGKEPSKTMKDKVNYYAFINPVFLTTDGIQKLENGKSYEADIDNELLTKELTKREKKKFLKSEKVD
ncbi:MAG TPA: M23 family metallopeptidase [Draconibacterium sp.]|nr:M23 family metallopeptidase [Draconibacterium sp.]